MMTEVHRLTPDEARLLALFREARNWAGFVPTEPLATLDRELQQSMTRWTLGRGRDRELRRRKGRGQ